MTPATPLPGCSGTRSPLSRRGLSELTETVVSMRERSVETAVVRYPELLRVAAMTAEIRASSVEALVQLRAAQGAGDWEGIKAAAQVLGDLEDWSIALQDTLRLAMRGAGKG